MPEGARLGIDWGKVRIGVAASNRRTCLAYPVETITAGPGELPRLVALIAEHDADVVYIGLPLTLAGTHAVAAGHVAAKAAALAAEVWPIPVLLVDERMSTVAASRSLGSAGRRARHQRSVIDQAAAVEILQRAIDAEERQGAPVGTPALKEES